MRLHLRVHVVLALCNQREAVALALHRPGLAEVAGLASLKEDTHDALALLQRAQSHSTMRARKNR